MILHIIVYIDKYLLSGETRDNILRAHEPIPSARRNETVDRSALGYGQWGRPCGSNVVVIVAAAKRFKFFSRLGFSTDGLEPAGLICQGAKKRAIYRRASQSLV